MPTIKARIGGAWVDVGGAGVSEVAIGPTDPGDSTTELWYDTDEPNLFDPDTARWNSAWGTVAYAQVTASQTGIGTSATDVNGLSVTFTPVAGRRYVTTTSWFGQTNSSGTTTVVARISDGANATLQQRYFVFLSGQYAHHPYVQVVETGLTAIPVTRKARYYTTVGTVDVVSDAITPAFIEVRDVGPVSSTAATPTYDLNPARWNSAWGRVSYAQKPSNQANFTTTETVISGLTVTTPSTTAGRIHQVEFSLRMIPTTPPPAASTIIIVNLRTGTTVGGSLIDTVQFQWPVHSTPYGWNLTGMIPVIGFPPNTAYSLTFSTDGTGVATLTSSSWVEIVDMGPVSMASNPPAQPASVWTDLALQGGLTWRTSGHKPQYRLVGDEVQLRGLIDVASTLAAATVFTTLPVGFRPLAAISYPMITAAGGPITLLARTSGTIEVFQGMTSVPTYFGIEVVRFSVTA